MQPCSPWRRGRRGESGSHLGGGDHLGGGGQEGLLVLDGEGGVHPDLGHRQSTGGAYSDTPTTEIVAGWEYGVTACIHIKVYSFGKLLY
jgi:hypothetical protein